MDVDLLAIVEADDAARQEVDSARRRVLERIERERTRLRDAQAAAEARVRAEHEGALVAIRDEAQRRALERRKSSDARRQARARAADTALSNAVERYVAILRRGEEAR